MGSRDIAGVTPLVLAQVASPVGIPSDPLQEGFHLLFPSLFQQALIPARKQQLTDMHESLLSLLDTGHSHSSLPLDIPTAQGLNSFNPAGVFFFPIFFP